MSGTDFYKMREYFYDKDYNFYHYLGKKDDGEFNIEKITRTEYKKQTGETDYIIEKLRNSAWPYQYNDYYFLKVDTPSGGTKYAPIDWKISNLVKYFNKNGIPTGNSTDQGTEIASIFIQERDDFKDAMENLFGSQNIISLEGSHDYANGTLGTRIKEIKEIILTHKVVIQTWDTTDSRRFGRKRKVCQILFSHKNFEWIHNKLGIKMPNHENSHKGRRIVSGKALDYLKKIF